MVNGYGWTSTRDIWVELFCACVKVMGWRFACRRVSLRYVLTAFLVVVKDLQRVTSKVRISYVTQRNNTFLFLFDLFSEFTSELRLFLKEVTLISFFFFFALFSQFTKRCGSESMDIHGGSS